MRAAAFFFLLALAGAAAPAQSPAWKPGRPVELIVAAGPGGGNDITARTIQRILQDNRLIGGVFNVVNKPGGGGAIAYAYLNQHAGDGHFLALSTPTLLTNHILGTSQVTYTDFTPVARLADEHMGFVVRADSPIRTGRDLVELLTKNPGSVKFAFGTSRGNANHIAIALVAKAAGVDPRKVTAVIFKATSEAVVAVQGGHVDVVPSTGATIVPSLEAGTLRAIAVTAAQRMPGVFAQVPTWKEQGVDAVVASNRSLIGPRAMVRAQLDYWDAVLGRMARTEDWKRDVEKNYWTPNYMNSSEAHRDLRIQYDQYKLVLSELGLVKP